MDYQIAENLIRAASGASSSRPSVPQQLPSLQAPKSRKPVAHRDHQEVVETATQQHSADKSKSSSTVNDSEAAAGGTPDVTIQQSLARDLDDHQLSHSSHDRLESSNGGLNKPANRAEQHDGARDLSSGTSSWATGRRRSLSDLHRSAAKQSLDEYNHFAAANGLTKLTEAPEPVRSSTSGESVNLHPIESEANEYPETSRPVKSHLKRRTKSYRWLPIRFPSMSKLHRTESNLSLKSKHASAPLRPKSSSSLLFPSTSRVLEDCLKDQTLEYVHVHGGLNRMFLPPEFSPIDVLVLPTCLAAAGSYLANHGKY